MTFRSQDEQRLLEAFLSWLVAHDDIEFYSLLGDSELVAEFLKSREVK